MNKPTISKDRVFEAFLSRPSKAHRVYYDSNLDRIFYSEHSYGWETIDSAGLVPLDSISGADYLLEKHGEVTFTFAHDGFLIGPSRLPLPDVILEHQGGYKPVRATYLRGDKSEAMVRGFSGFHAAISHFLSQGYYLKGELAIQEPIQSNLALIAA